MHAIYGNNSILNLERKWKGLIVIIPQKENAKIMQRANWVFIMGFI